ncbi:hypothetical protein JCM10212_000359 [Sporobolomyces blumeae]
MSEPFYAALREPRDSRSNRTRQGLLNRWKSLTDNHDPSSSLFGATALLARLPSTLSNWSGTGKGHTGRTSVAESVTSVGTTLYDPDPNWSVSSKEARGERQRGEREEEEEETVGLVATDRLGSTPSADDRPSSHPRVLTPLWQRIVTGIVIFSALVGLGIGIRIGVKKVRSTVQDQAENLRSSSTTTAAAATTATTNGPTLTPSATTTTPQSTAPSTSNPGSTSTESASSTVTSAPITDIFWAVEPTRALG